MPSNSLLHFITKVINFEGFQARNYYFITENELMIELENKAKEVICPHCNKSTDKVHQSHWYRVRDIPLALLEKRNKETILEYLRGLGSELLNQIEEVSIDLWVPYKSVVEELIPNARVVADRFHVMKQINEELDRERRKEKRAANKIKNKKERDRKIQVITHSKYPLLKSKENLNEREKDKLAEVQKSMPSLIEMYQMKEDFRDIFNRKITEDEAFWCLVEWMALAYQKFPQSCQTIKRWFEEILAYFNHRTTQGAVEGINQKIKLIKRRAYGLTNFANFRRRVLLNWHFCC